MTELRARLDHSSGLSFTGRFRLRAHVITLDFGALLGGSIEAESKPDQGSIFTLRLPLDE